MTGRHPTARRDGIHAMPRHARASALLLLVTLPAGPGRRRGRAARPGPVPPGLAAAAARMVDHHPVALADAMTLVNAVIAGPVLAAVVPR
jgi:hypothetical protein